MTTPTGEHPQATRTPAAASSAQAEQSKPNTPFEAAGAVVRSVQLEDVRFHAVSARALEASRAMPEDVAFVASTRFLRPTVKSTGDGFSTQTTLAFQVGGQTPGGEPLNPYAVIQATLEARYSLKSGTQIFGEEDLKDFALCYCPFHVWGYWREFVQSSLARLDLPQFTIPLFLIHQAPQMVQDKLDQ